MIPAAMPQFSVELLKTPSEVQPYQSRWNELAGSRPQLRWEWLGAWAIHYCFEKQLMVLVVRDGDRIIGFTPWYIEQPQFAGRQIRFLGSGQACTDHLTLLTEPGLETAVAYEIADWVLKNRINGPSRSSQWTHMKFVGVDRDDAAMRTLVHALADEKCDVDSRPGMPCFEIELPDSMEEFVARRSKSGKRDCRKIRDWLAQDRFRIFTPTTADELKDVWYDFVDLHELRRRKLGDGGCFEHVPFGEFLWEASSRLLETNHLRLTFVCDGDHPVSVQHALVSDDRWLYYQSGMDPAYQDFKAGQIVLYHTIEQSIREGKRCFDMMRGDEAYKSRWRAEEKLTVEYRIAAPHRVARFQQRTWQLQKRMKAWARRSASVLGQSSSS